MKRNFKLSLILIMVFLLSFSLSACFNDSAKSPEDLIKDAYGNSEYKISFSSDTLDKPIGDLTYSAKLIPTLPIPQKVGYIFEGWFFDPDFVMPYQDSSLLLTMKDVTLYPKWSKETFLHNGTYDIEFDAKILPETLKKGKSTDLYGGYRDITKLFNISECYIEKSNDELLLKLQYDSIVTTPYQTSDYVFTVIPSKNMPSDIRIKDRIDSLADPVKTLFIAIDKWDLSSPLYFDVTWTNFEDSSLSDLERRETTTSYQIKLELTKIIGFSQSFVDPSVPLEKGYYLAKSFFRKEDNGETMGKQFNPVYSYIYSDGNENYTLIKQNTPYTGLVINDHGIYQKPLDYYYDLNMAFTSIMTAIDIKRQDEEIVLSDYYPETYDAGSYHKVGTEFNADTGKTYNIIELSKDLSREYLCLTAVSGYMERGEGMGYVRQILSIDYKNLIKLADVDYTPVSGQAYEYQDKFSFYPGNYNDLSHRNIPYDATLEYGISIEMPNFYFSAPNLGAPIEKRKMHSSYFEVTPDSITKALKVNESRGVLGVFDFNAKIYDYEEARDGNLYVDRLNPQSFEDSPYSNPEKGSYNNQLHDKRQVKNGLSIEKNTLVDIRELFETKVSKTMPFNEVNYNIYSYENGKINYQKVWNSEDGKIFCDKELVVEFNYNFNGKKGLTPVYLTFETKPTITKLNNGDISWELKAGTDNHYVTKNKDLIVTGNQVKYPDITYTWGDITYGKLIESYYNFGLSINPSKAAVFGLREGYNQLYLVTSHSDVMEIKESNSILVYELNNSYNERYYVYFEYLASPKKTYVISNNEGLILREDDVEFKKDKDDPDLIYRVPAYTEYTYKTLVDDIFTDDLFKKYYHDEDGVKREYKLNSYNVYSNKGNLMNQNASSKAEMTKTINNFLKDKDYGLVTLKYYTGSDWLIINYPYKISYGGLNDYYALNNKAYFTDTDYFVSKTKLTTYNHEALANIKISVKKLVNNRPTKNSYEQADGLAWDEGEQFRIFFKVPGHYRITYSYDIPSYVLGDSKNTNYTHLAFNEDVYVNSSKSDVKITYYTDEMHPFNDGKLTKTVKGNLGDGLNFITSDRSQFYLSEERSKDILVSLESKNATDYNKTYIPGYYMSGEEAIKTFNDLEIHLKVIWKIAFTVKINFNDSKFMLKEPSMQSGRYELTLPNNNYVPSDKIFLGYSGGFLGGSIRKAGERVYVPYNGDPLDPMYEIHAVYADKITITYKILEEDKNLATIRPKQAIIPEGSIIMECDPKYQPVVRMRDSSYEFVGFYIEGKPNEIIDLYSYVFTSDTVLVAKFKKI